MSNKVVLYVATSRDGFIAGKNDELDWLPQPGPDITEDCGYKNFYASIDVIVSGFRTYNVILGFGAWPYPDKKTYVFAPTPMASDNPVIEFTTESVKEFMQAYCADHPDSRVWLLGGAALAKSFSDAGLIDEIIVTIFPLLLGEGIFLDIDYGKFNLVDTKHFESLSAIQKIYVKKM